MANGLRMTEQEYAALQQRKNNAIVTREEKAACVTPLPTATGAKPMPKFKSKTEAEYHNMLEIRKKAGEILWHRHEGVTLDLGDVRYTPDFLVLKTDGTLEVWEIKGGYVRPDSLVKLKIAASMFPFRFFMAQKTKEGWTEKQFS